MNIHIRDCKRNNGPSRPFGQGDTPIKEVLRLIRDNQYPIRCYLEDQYGSFRFSVEEVKRCLEVPQAGAGVALCTLVALLPATSHAQGAPGKPDAGGMPAPTVALERGRTGVRVEHVPLLPRRGSHEGHDGRRRPVALAPGRR